MFSVVIPYREHSSRDGRIERLALSLYADPIPVEVIVSDQSPLPPLSVSGRAQVIIHEPQEPFSRARAINRGVRLVSHPWVLVMDVDVILPSDVLAQIMDLLRSTPLRTYATFTVLEGSRPHFNPPFYWGSDAVMFSRALWEEVGGYEEGYRGYGFEDADFCDRCVKAGATIMETGLTFYHESHPQVEGIYEDLEKNRRLYEGRKDSGIL
jgi:predicted glycosyltransferase involved in capsule biosynthesis